MADNDTAGPSTPDLTGLPENLQREIVAFRAALPFLSRCLSLNHDINNPLAGIIGYAEVSLEDGDSQTEELRTSLEHILLCAEKIKALSDGLSEGKARLIETGVIDLIRQMSGES